LTDSVDRRRKKISTGPAVERVFFAVMKRQYPELWVACHEGIFHNLMIVADSKPIPDTREKS